MKSIEVSGKTVKDAISRGLAELGCDSSDVDIQVIEMGSPGLFGMFGKPAKVRLTVKDDDSSLGIEMPVFSLDQPTSSKRRGEGKKKDKPKAEKVETPKEEPVKDEPKVAQPVAEEKSAVEEKPKTERKPRRREHSKEPKVVKEPKPAKEVVESKEPATSVSEPMEPKPFVAMSDDELSDTAKKARAFLLGLTEKMGVLAEIAVCETEEQLRMVLSGENMSILIGRRGETLDALQYLTSLNVNRTRDEYLRVSLDTENYRAKREEALRKLAIRMAGRCKKSGRRVALEPMNPYERRILHSALQADPDVTTHSEGEEPYRRVIITLK